MKKRDTFAGFCTGRSFFNLKSTSLLLWAFPLRNVRPTLLVKDEGKKDIIS